MLNMVKIVNFVNMATNIGMDNLVSRVEKVKMVNIVNMVTR